MSVLAMAVPLGALLAGSSSPAVGGLPADADTLRYSVILAGNRAGEQIVHRAEDGSLNIHFEFNDRGRGPVIDATYRLDAKGIPSAIRVSGVDYFKAQVNERFDREAQRGRWSSTAERGDATGADLGVYLALQGPPEGLAVLARALLADPDQRLPLLPAGSAAIERAMSRTVEFDGRQRTVTYYLVEGLDFTPTGVWLDPDGTLFAAASGWTSVVVEGWEAVVPTLVAAQDSVDATRNRAVARRLADRPSTPVVITGVNLFDAERAVVRKDMAVVVEGNRITAVGPEAEIRVPDGARRIEGHGRTLLPGLWDMHSHLGDTDGPLNISAGVTSVRDLANNPEELAARRARWDAGEAVGPRVVMAGFIDGHGPYAGPTQSLASTPEELTRWIDWYADHGYSQVKLYSSLKPDLVPVATERAHARGLRVSGHIPAGMRARDAVAQGYDEIQHINMLVLNFLSDTLDTRRPVRFTEPGRHAADLDLASDSVRAFIRLLADRGIVVDPTLATFEGMYTARAGEVSVGDARMAPHLPSQIRRGLAAGGLPADETLGARYEASYRRMLEFVRALHESGVRIVAGTDCMAGFCLQRELELYSEAGIPNAEVLRLATYGAATVAGRAESLGSIRAGKLADLVLIDGDPLADMRNIRRVSLVIKDGVIYDPAAVQRTLGITPWQDLPTIP